MAGTRARLNLEAMKTRSTPPLAVDGEDTRRGQTLRLKPAAWTQLKILAAEQQKPSHDLLIEAVNLLFEHYGKPTIAG